MSLANCPKCHNLYTKDAKITLCSDCQQEEHNLAQEIYNHVLTNPGISLADLSEAFGVSEMTLRNMFKFGTLSKMYALVRSTCAMCRREIWAINRMGQFCYQCHQQVEHDWEESRHKHRIVPSLIKPYLQKLKAKPSKLQSRSEGGACKFGFKRMTGD